MDLENDVGQKSFEFPGGISIGQIVGEHPCVNTHLGCYSWETSIAMLKILSWEPCLRYAIINIYIYCNFPVFYFKLSILCNFSAYYNIYSGCATLWRHTHLICGLQTSRFCYDIILWYKGSSECNESTPEQAFEVSETWHTLINSKSELSISCIYAILCFTIIASQWIIYYWTSCSYKFFYQENLKRMLIRALLWYLTSTLLFQMMNFVRYSVCMEKSRRWDVLLVFGALN